MYDCSNNTERTVKNVTNGSKLFVARQIRDVKLVLYSTFTWLKYTVIRHLKLTTIMYGFKRKSSFLFLLKKNDNPFAFSQ
jgi:hypothetical protein